MARTDGVTLIAFERQRQIDAEGYNAAHDAGHAEELAMAGATYAMSEPDRFTDRNDVPATWPWKAHDWKPVPENRIRELVKAGALIAAAIDSLSAETPRGAVMDLASLRPLSEAATAGEWTAGGYSWNDREVWTHDGSGHVGSVNAAADAAFLVAAVNAVRAAMDATPDVVGHRHGVRCGVESAGLGATECQHVGSWELTRTGTWDDPEPVIGADQPREDDPGPLHTERNGKVFLHGHPINPEEAI